MRMRSTPSEHQRMMCPAAVMAVYCLSRPGTDAKRRTRYEEFLDVRGLDQLAPTVLTDHDAFPQKCYVAQNLVPMAILDVMPFTWVYAPCDDMRKCRRPAFQM